MGTVRYYDDNQRIQLHGELALYEETVLTSDRMVLVYDEASHGPLPDERPYRIKFVVEDGEVETFDSGPYAGQHDYTAGTLSKVILYDADGDIVMSIAGLDLSMPYISAMLRAEDGWNVVNHVLAQGHTFRGSDIGYAGDPDRGDAIQTGHGNDRVFAGDGNDAIIDTGGKDVYRGGAGIDAVVYFNHRWASPEDTQGIVARIDKGYVIGTDGIRDAIYSIEEVQGSMFNDRMIGDNGENRFEGLGGNDYFNGKGGWDILLFDARDWLGALQGVRVDMGEGKARDAWGNLDRFRNIEEVRGTDYQDVFRDDTGDNILRGRGGNDRFFFGRGNDEAEGGDGADTFVFRGNAFGNDRIWDFEDGVDRLRVWNAPDFEALTVEQDGDNTLVTWNGNEIRLDDVMATDITADDFIF